MSLKNNFRLRAGCVCFVNADCKSILAVQSLKTPEAWCLPGGGIESGESAHFAAKRELFEEAGILANINRCIGLFKNGSRVTVMFEATMTDSLNDWPEKSDRKRGWYATEEVCSLLKSDYQRFILNTWSDKLGTTETYHQNCSAGISFTSTQNEAAAVLLLSLIEETNANKIESPVTAGSNENPPPGTAELFPEHESGKVPLFVFETTTMMGRSLGYVDISGLNPSNISPRIDEVVAQSENSESSLPLTA